MLGVTVTSKERKTQNQSGNRSTMCDFHPLLVLAIMQIQCGVFRVEEVLIFAPQIYIHQGITHCTSPYQHNWVRFFSTLVWAFLVHFTSEIMSADQWCSLCGFILQGHSTQRGPGGNFILLLFVLLVTEKRDPQQLKSEFCIWRTLPSDF